MTYTFLYCYKCGKPFIMKGFPKRAKCRHCGRTVTPRKSAYRIFSNIREAQEHLHRVTTK